MVFALGWVMLLYVVMAGNNRSMYTDMAEIVGS